MRIDQDPRTLWKVIESRDELLGDLRKELFEMEANLQEKEAQINLLAQHAREKDLALIEKETAIKRLSSEIETRSTVINAFSSIARAVDDTLQRFNLSSKSRIRNHGVESASSATVQGKDETKFSEPGGIAFENLVTRLEQTQRELSSLILAREEEIQRLERAMETERMAKVAPENRVLELERKLLETEKVVADRLTLLEQLQREKESILDSKAYKLGSSILRLLHRKQPSGSH
jgi:chromosome segregation ATPase